MIENNILICQVISKLKTFFRNDRETISLQFFYTFFDKQVTQKWFPESDFQMHRYFGKKKV